MKALSLPIVLLIISFYLPESVFVPLMLGTFLGGFWVLWVTDK